MTRENFYFLLELPVDPPEEAPEVIEKAIKKKQIEWSRNRNHPTKGIQAQTNIGLMPTIREVMFSPALRDQEVAKAQEILQQRDAQKFAVADHHVSILGTKGYISEDEINQLAQFDNVDADELRARIKFPDEPPKKRKLRKPKILGANDDKKKSSTHTLDKTVERNINDNLKQIDKASLYDFLEIPSNSPLKKLQQRTRDKKSALSEISKKDANLTASDTLAGQCISIFKNSRNRKAYDASRASAHHAELNSDIDIAGLDGFIRDEYFEYLIKTGVNFGMDEAQAINYIEEYCLINNLKIERAPRQMSKTMRIALGVIAGLVLIIAIVVGWGFHSENKEEEERVAKEKLEQERVRLYDEAVGKADGYVAEEKYEDAIKVYKQFSEAHVGTDKSKNAVNQITSIKNKIDEKNFNQVQRIDPTQYDQKLFALLEHRKKFPKGKYHKEIKKLIADIKEPFYRFFNKMIKLHKQPDKENWNECIRLSQLFANTYTNDIRTDDLNRNIKKYEENALIKESFEKKQAIIGAVDYDTAKKEYKGWLEKHFSKYYAKILIKRELKKILKNEKGKRKKKAVSDIRWRLKTSGGRFKVTHKGVVQDLRTGKMWTLLDSAIDYDFQNYGECLNYFNAKKYVKRLRVGGYKDWRIPKQRELRNIYEKKPIFPLNKTEWYWTSQSYPSYDEGISGLVVDIIFPNSKNIRENNPPTDAKFCGAVRAVRP
ncbi:DUF1566 domain-containing protein [Desulfococcaceae bacterium HSG9]|nr:DUF1566 domain-containing protein [Desulfococcaceae bacterium HSG9]